MSDETRYQNQYYSPDEIITETEPKQRERYTETITRDRDEDAGTGTGDAAPSDADSAGGTIDPGGNVQAPLEDDGA